MCRFFGLRCLFFTGLAYGSGLLYDTRGVIPKPLDPRLLVRVSTAVARAAMESGVARKPVTDWKAYERELADLLR